jgi:5-methylthioadenosine/S-adenosylhomocysteine deaminase
MRVRFYNGKILTMQNGVDILEGVELHTQGDSITYLGETLPECGEFDREIDLDGNLLMPSFKDAHTHSPMTCLRSYADDLPLKEWLYDRVFPLEATLTFEQIYWFSKLAMMEYLTSGISACFDMYIMPEAVAKASTEMGFRTVLCGTVNDFKDSVGDLEEFYLKYNDYNDLISYRLGFHAEYTTSLEIMQGVARLSQQYQTPVYMHSSETKKEVTECIQRYGKTPTQLFNDIGLFEYGGGSFHCVYMSDTGFKIFRDKGLWVVTNPASNLKLASGIAPISEMQEYGINLALGTDGASSNNALDMFREMFLVTALQKYKTKDASSCSAESVLEMATVGSAKAMCLNDVDTLDVGKKADIIVIDMHQPNMNPIYNVKNNLVYSGSKQNVKLTMVNGNILYEDGKFLTVDANEVYSMCEKLKFN